MGSPRHPHPAILRRLALAIALLSGCGDGAGPGTAGPLFTAVTLDSRPWKPDTAYAILNGSIVIISMQRNPYPGTPAQEPLAIILEAFTGPGNYVLSDGLADNQGYYPVRDSMGQTPFIFSTRSSHPGHATITGYDPADSTIAGSFSFTVYAQTDTTRFHTFSGQFRLRDAY